ncbi:MAG: phosphotransferase [Niabella sp.]
MVTMHRVLSYYGFKKDEYAIKNFGNGLINDTCHVKNGEEQYILQRVNTHVFTRPYLIADNIEKIQSFINSKAKDYFFAAPLRTLNGESLLHLNGSGYYRIFPFVKDSHTIDVVQTPDQAYEAAKQFGKFTSILSGIDIASLNITLPSFHDLLLRYEQFSEVLKTGNAGRRRKAQPVIDSLKTYSDIVEEYNRIKANPEVKLRVTHHDTKINNVLFDKNNRGICVIDLDTVMPGYFISDVGDMMRTYLCPVSEEEQDLTKIKIRDEFYYAIVRGYRVYMDGELTETEKKLFFYSGKFMIYMQALRFITDYINNDIYYTAKYPEHNFVRAQNQLTLLQRFLEKEAIFSDAYKL